MAARERRDDDTSSEPPDILDIDLDDLDEDAPDTVLPPAPAGDALVVELEDLDDIPDVPAAYPSPADKVTSPYPPVTGGGPYPPMDMSAGYDLYAKAKKRPGAAIFGNMMLQMLIAGLIGGVLAWAIDEPGMQSGGGAALADEEAVRETMIFSVVLGALIGMARGAGEGLLTGAYSKMVRDAALGLAIGAPGGAYAGFSGLIAFNMLLPGGDQEPALGQKMVARTIAWALVGVFIGLAQGARDQSTGRIVTGLMGGLIGGAVGGLLFDPIGASVGGGTMSRFIGQAVMGAAIGAAIGLLEEMRKEAWVTIVEGPLTSKEFILYRQTTTIGAAPHCDIPLLKDRSVAPEHARGQQSGGAFLLVSLVGAEWMLGNGQPSGSHALKSGDMFRIGSTTRYYHSRAIQ